MSLLTLAIKNRALQYVYPRSYFNSPTITFTKVRDTESIEELSWDRMSLLTLAIKNRGFYVSPRVLL